jgi:hypothetical protein
MGKPKPPAKAKLILGLLAPDLSHLEALKMSLIKKWGEIDHKSETIRFDFTDYYEAELGRDLLRYWLSFKDCTTPEVLPDLKRYTDELELSCARADGRRTINLDPGYLTLGSLILATTKPAPHRIYLRDNIYADLTLIYERGSFKPLSWTYPDYRTEAAIRFFNQVRESLRQYLLSYSI